MKLLDWKLSLSQVHSTEVVALAEGSALKLQHLRQTCALPSFQRSARAQGQSTGGNFCNAFHSLLQQSKESRTSLKSSCERVKGEQKNQPKLHPLSLQPSVAISRSYLSVTLRKWFWKYTLSSFTCLSYEAWPPDKLPFIQCNVL